MHINNPGKLIVLAILALANMAIAVFMLAHSPQELRSNDTRMVRDTARSHNSGSFGSAVLTQAQPSRAAYLTWL
jgi:hypothetical protein